MQDDGGQLPDAPARSGAEADSRVHSDVDDEEEVRRPEGSDDEGEDLLEGMEGCAYDCRPSPGPPPARVWNKMMAHSQRCRLAPREARLCARRAEMTGNDGV